jgi:hypothetical protein
MSNKDYTVHFHHTSVGPEGRPMHAWLWDAHVEHGEHLPRWKIGGNEYLQVRNLRLVHSVWMGDIAKLRDDAPLLVDERERESELDLSDGRRVLERCHFLYRQKDDVLVLQRVRGVSALSHLQMYFSQVLGAAVMLPQVMNEEELEKVLSRDLYELSFDYARPKKAPGGIQYTQAQADMMRELHAATAKFVLRAPRGGRLAKKAANLVRGLIREEGVDKVRVKPTDDMEMVDLFMAPLRGSITVPLVGRYASPKAVFEGLEEEYERLREFIPDR